MASLEAVEVELCCRVFGKREERESGTRQEFEVSAKLQQMEEWKLSPRMGWWQKMINPVRRVWIGVATRLRIRKTGLLKLRHDVRACEYEDIHVMWEMLRRNETEFANSPGKSKRQYWKLVRWARYNSFS